MIITYWDFDETRLTGVSVTCELSSSDSTILVIYPVINLRLRSCRNNGKYKSFFSILFSFFFQFFFFNFSSQFFFNFLLTFYQVFFLISLLIFFFEILHFRKIVFIKFHALERKKFFFISLSYQILTLSY